MLKELLQFFVGLQNNIPALISFVALSAIALSALALYVVLKLAKRP